MGLTKPFTQIPSEALTGRVESDHPAGRTVACVLSVHTTMRPIPHYLYLESHAGISAVSGEGRPLTKELQLCESSRSVDWLSRKGSVRWGSWGMGRSCDPPWGNDAVSTAGPRGMTRLTGASAKGRPAAVRGHRRAEGKTGIHCIPAHHQHMHELMAH